jgi:hypothetical protein
MKRLCIACLILVGALVARSSAHAGIIEDLASAQILEDFLFNDDAGIQIQGAANSANSGNLMDEDTDNNAVVTNGVGQLNASLKDNDELGTNYVDTRAFTSGRVLGVMELTWDFDSQTLDTAENEEIRISLIQFDPRSTFVTAEWEIQREDDNTVTILGNGVGTGATDLGPVVLNGGSLTQSSKFIAVVDADLDSSTYFLHYSNDGGANFTTLGPADLDPTRGIESMRLTLNNNLVGDNVLIDRAYLAYIPEPTTGALAALAGLALVGLRGVRGRIV